MEWGATLAVVALKSTVQLLQSKSERKSPDEIDATTMISPCYQQRIVIKSTYRWFQDEDGRQLPFSLLSDTKIFQAPHSGDHLVKRISFEEAKRRSTAGYWGLQLDALTIDSVHNIIQGSRQLATIIHSIFNPG
ncbi:uncharacterized protein PHALS_11067 [Plasmopara halstedii]|uniref:Uncharacterized protein n=1 Tax=Plasmopara halstedii TaxID=4781 RepID=A0A0P1AJ50_PLAHL|nr:uncharacterized protein PHALS_11067 [Plasmopara halstedii]CEG40889.1 hypothetical protein PHALS_11067 [Plasmopara halstedii]|eukprot:XP_024577258.1 hypothetical protein PHALS_11067 [Plasmopara halstedii]